MNETNGVASSFLTYSEEWRRDPFAFLLSQGETDLQSDINTFHNIPWKTSSFSHYPRFIQALYLVALDHAFLTKSTGAIFNKNNDRVWLFDMLGVPYGRNNHQRTILVASIILYNNRWTSLPNFVSPSRIKINIYDVTSYNCMALAIFSLIKMRHLYINKAKLNGRWIWLFLNINIWTLILFYLHLYLIKVDWFRPALARQLLNKFGVPTNRCDR